MYFNEGTYFDNGTVGSPVCMKLFEISLLLCIRYQYERDCCSLLSAHQIPMLPVFSKGHSFFCHIIPLPEALIGFSETVIQTPFSLLVSIAESQHISILHPCDVKIKVSLCSFDTPSLPVSIGLAGYIMAGAAVQTVIQLLAGNVCSLMVSILISAVRHTSDRERQTHTLF